MIESSMKISGSSKGSMVGGCPGPTTGYFSESTEESILYSSSCAEISGGNPLYPLDLFALVKRTCIPLNTLGYSEWGRVA